jgi:general transcription factor 3C polypeptide 5 (transcription factor C subunit 1)
MHTRSHIFDGKTQSSEIASFQLCDIQDPMLVSMIESETELRDTCNVSRNCRAIRLTTKIFAQERDGWYQSAHLEGIKAILRHKFFSLLEGRVPTDEECTKLLSSLSESRNYTHGSTYARKSRKHNKAKGALPPEEAAVCPHTTFSHQRLTKLPRQSAFERFWHRGNLLFRNLVR